MALVSLCLYPGSSGAKNECLGHCAVTVVVHVTPDTQGGSAQRWELACGRQGQRTSFGEGSHGWESPQRRACLAVANGELKAPCSFEAVARPIVLRLSYFS